MNDTRPRRPGYYLMRPNGAIDAKVFKKAFSQENSAEFETFVKPIQNLQPVLRAFEITELSHRDVHERMKQISSQLLTIPTAPLGGMPLVRDADVRMHQCVMAFLSSVRSFLDHSGTVLIRLDRAGSQEFKPFKAHQERLYDEHFSYRFLYKLRNMSQHVTLPISTVTLSAKHLGPTDGLQWNVSLTLDRDELLARWPEWGTTVKRDLEGQSPRFELLPLLDEEIGWMNELFRGVIERKSNELRSSSEYLLALLRLIRAPLGAVPVLWVGDSTAPNTPPPGMEVPPFEDVRRFADIMGWVQA
jgi:hypothetical protein